MIESPLIQEIEAKKSQEAIRVVLERRFGSVPQQVITGIAEVLDQEKLRDLIGFGVDCKDIKAFRKKLKEEAGHD